MWSVQGEEGKGGCRREDQSGGHCVVVPRNEWFGVDEISKVLLVGQA